MAARATSDMASGGGASMGPGWVRVSAPATADRVVASVVMMSEAMTVRALSVEVKAQPAFCSICGGKGH